MISTAPIDSDPSGLLDAWLETRRQIATLEAQASHLLAERMRVMAADAAEHPSHRTMIERSMVAEYAAAGRIAQGTMDFAFTDAAFLEQGQPDVLAAFHAGVISAAHVREIVRASGVLREAISNGRAGAAALATFDTAARVVAEAETPARTAAHLKRLAAGLAGDTVVDRHERARSERVVTMRPVDDGLALLTVVLPEHLAVAIMDRLTQLARGVLAARRAAEASASESDQGVTPLGSLDRAAIFADGTFTTDPGRFASSDGSGPDTSDTASASHESPHDGDAGPACTDSRTIDQVRADLLTDLLLAAEPSPQIGTGLDNIRGRIQVTIAATTLAGLDERPAELDGFGPLHPDAARDLAGRNLGWSRLFLDAGGLVTETDTYTPTEPMRRFLRARDQHCRFPGCRMPVHRCEIDHTHDHAKGGRTDVRNLAHVCRGHHALKHPDIADDHRWSARQLADGTVDWLSPSGRSYRDSPRRRVMFV